MTSHYSDRLLDEIGEQAGCSLVEDGKAVAAGFVAERAGKPTNIRSKLSFNIRIIRAPVSA
ncbi:hypothetical protein CQ13_39725 [Bradyrhizobium retamae]|uniref:Uncharacterized protein n=1 Tax=Bradyrhizobium retamae TaxID=1300035 RepID=A0A0R3N6L1_9BRAD|nr:hypothetical protein CQ13_39725 [Bradyrhizobium retamae]